MQQTPEERSELFTSGRYKEDNEAENGGETARRTEIHGVNGGNRMKKTMRGFAKEAGRGEVMALVKGQGRVSRVVCSSPHKPTKKVTATPQ